MDAKQADAAFRAELEFRTRQNAACTDNCVWDIQSANQVEQESTQAIDARVRIHHLALTGPAHNGNDEAHYCRGCKKHTEVTQRYLRGVDKHARHTETFDQCLPQARTHATGQRRQM